MNAEPWLEKLEALRENLKKLGGVLVAFSGGADSTFLLAVSRQALSLHRVLAVTAISPSFPLREKEEVIRLARFVKARHRFINTDEMNNPDYISNPSNRCFFCKDQLFQTLSPLAEPEGLRIVDGFNRSDRSDFRPGYAAARRWGVFHPLEETGLTKEEIRRASLFMNLPTWNKPASPCLSSRVPYGTPITEKLLRRIDQAEEVVRGAGFQTVRVRHLGDRARVEVGPEELPRLLDHGLQGALQKKLEDLGYEDVFFDPEGYRSGRLNESLKGAAT